MSDDDGIMIDDEEDEMIIGDDGEDNNIFYLEAANDEDSPKQINFRSFLQPQIDQCNTLSPHFEAEAHGSELKFHIPSEFLPTSLQMVCGFYLSPILIDVTLTFKEDSWRLPLIQFSATHPIFNQNYVGRPLVLDTIRKFFTNSFIAKPQYKSMNLLLPNSKNLEYDSHQLLFLIMEITDSFLDLQDHCCICHCPLQFSVIKPTICNKALCEVAFNEVGAGSSVAQEIRRDPFSADLLMSLFACSFHNGRYTNPAPPQEVMQTASRLFNTLPKMVTISERCQNDTDIIKLYGNDTLELLRWVILSNKSQLIHLPDELKLKSIGFQTHFMTLLAAQEQEEAFQKKKKKNGNRSLFMWHGSGGDRWHSIIRNGLMNMSNKDCIHGASYGPGIYLASDYSTSLGYAQPVSNLYKNSMFGNSLTCLALCEVVPVSQYKDFGGVATLQDEEALIVRFIFPICNISYSNMYNGTSGCMKINVNEIPKLSDVLSYLGEKDVIRMNDHEIEQLNRRRQTNNGYF